jgi:asparagine synthase (glutamine-hydrolysing)
MLAACVEWGAEQAIARFVGMFAFALFDRQTRTLRLVRDRLGVKPLYWAVLEGVLLFGSELRALMAHRLFRRHIDPEAIAAVLRYSYVPAPATVFRGVFKLPAGSILTASAGCEPRIAPYWTIADIIARAAAPCSAVEAVDRLDTLMRDAVRRRMIADVPLGAFLSGGTDSATVVALMQAQSERPVRSFTIGFRDAAYDESGHAREVARHLGTDHTEVVLEPTAALDLVARVPDWFDEPFADSSQLPTYLVASVTRAHVTVALSGDGGDELFGGYPKYRWLDRVWHHAGGLPRPLRAGLGGLAAALPERLLRRTIAAIDPARAERVGEKARRLAAALAARNGDEAAVAVAAVGLSDSTLVRGASGSLRLAPLGAPGRCLPDLAARMQAHDMVTYLPDDILAKVDRCSMAVALEAREPLLDHRLVELVWSLPPGVRRGDGKPKALLRALLARYLPPALIDRPKHGFSVPLAGWLRGPLRDWGEDLLAPARLSASGLFEVTRTRAIWERHLSGVQDNATGLWNILMVQAWARRWSLGA